MRLTAAAVPRPLRPGQEVRMAWILLLLDRGTSYGYALSRELDAHGLSSDPAAMYRMLRKLDQDGWVTSQWTTSSAGPRRRSYRLTAKGRRVLDDMARLIAGTRDVYDTFLLAYEPERKGRRSSSMPRSAAR